MERRIREFISYLHNMKKMSNNTEVSYQRDLKKLAAFLKSRGIDSVEMIKEGDLLDYLLYMENANFATSSICRNIASIKAFCQYFYKMGIIDKDLSVVLKAPKVEKKMPEILSVEEVDRLLKQPDQKTAKGIRDQAMLELLYATGMRVSELLHVQVKDVNLTMGYVVCHENEKERIIPIGKICKKALENYLENARQQFAKLDSVEELFTNCSGKAMSRQGFWKVLKGYAQSAGIEGDITPHTLRHSFAVHMLQNGADVKSVQEMMGHSDISTTQLYLNFGKNKMRDVYMKAHPRC
ncbi:MAG: site-specific tyrosine recombinase XerD [Eubacteriales bacterium]|nr:site-specific tyrosine recombinase XerD [Eubacteriales bacterium]